jgi:tRNA-Thr(GGU) m(6)t(6)A37 methyltransferase TsaA
MNPIGTLRTCFTEKFGAPRQSLMVPEARGVLKLNPTSGFREALNHLDRFSHVWVIFLFHHHKDWTPTIEAPRIDGPKRVGVFASRSPHRPNPIGMSAVKLDRIDLDAPGGVELHLSGVDILDGTPVLDIKPYLPYADSVPEATSGWAASEIRRYEVEFAPQALEQTREDARFRTLITQVLELDPRPRSQRESMPVEDPACEGKRFAFRLMNIDVKWEIAGGKIRVRELVEG